MKRKVLVSSLLSMLMSLGVVVGGTFAVFTSESETNIAISSGKVEVVATAELVETSSRDVVQESGKFANGGTATISDGLVDLKLLTPGDRAVFTIKVTNNSNVAVKYRTKIQLLEGKELFEGLEVKFGEEVFDGNTLYSNWNDAVAGEFLSTNVSVELPYGAGNKFQDLTTKFVFAVEAIQANADLPASYFVITKDNLDQVNWSAENVAYSFTGDFDDAISIPELGKDSTLTFNNVNVNSVVTLPDGAVITGENTITSTTAAFTSAGNVTLKDGSLKINSSGNAFYLNGSNAVLTIENMDVESTGNFVVENKDETSCELVIKNSKVYLPNKNSFSVSSMNGYSNMDVYESWIDCGPIFVGGHTMNYQKSTVSFNVRKSYLYSRSTTLGSAIAIWGKSGVEGNIEDSDVYVYHQGWHQSEDANGNSMTFQGGKSIDVNITRSNMHLYGAHSVLRVRRYYDSTSPINVDVKDSFIWTTSKDGSSGLSIDGNTSDGAVTTTNIQDSVLLRVRKAYTNDTTVDSEIIGNPSLYGNLSIITQCNWPHTLTLDNQVLTITKDAKINKNDGMAEIAFELKGSAKVIIEEGAEFKNFEVVAAEGYTLETKTVNGVTTYSVK